MTALMDQMAINPPAYEGMAPNKSKVRTKSMSSTKSHTNSVSSDYSLSGSTVSGFIDSSEDEGELPSYRPALTKIGVLQMKPELSSPFMRTKNRNWRACLIEVNNTQLRMTSRCCYGLASKTKVYSLQFAEIGLATDYEKRPNSFRLRVETQQFMFDCVDRSNLLGWLVSIQMAISLALPLELRQLPEEVKRLRNRQRDIERRRAREERRRANDEDHCNMRSHHSRHRRERNGPSRRHQDSDDTKWEPRRRSSRFSEKDFPHLLIDTTWEGKSVIYRGQWALIRNRQIIFVLSEKKADRKPVRIHSGTKEISI